MAHVPVFPDVVPDVVENDKINWSEAQLNARLVTTSLAGQAVGFENAAGVVLKHATDLFAIGKDAEAKLLRELSTKLKELSQGERRKQSLAQQEYDRLYKD